MTTINSTRLHVGSFSFKFDTGNFVSYHVYATAPIQGIDNYALERTWQRDGKSEDCKLGYYETIDEACEFGLSSWSQYILADEMPDCVVTGVLDAEDIRDMMLYIQEPELLEGDEDFPVIDIDPLELALNAIGETIDGLLHHLTVVGHVPAIYDEIESLTCTVALIRSLGVKEEIKSNE